MMYALRIQTVLYQLEM